MRDLARQIYLQAYIDSQGQDLAKAARECRQVIEMTTKEDADHPLGFTKGLIWGEGGRSSMHPEFIMPIENVLVIISSRDAEFFANDFFWQITERGETMTRTAEWRDLGRPEAALIGVEYRGNDLGGHYLGYIPAEQRTQQAALRFNVIMKRLDSEQRLDPGKQFFRENRLVQKIISAGFDPVQLVFPIAESGDKYEGDQPGGRIFLQFAAKLITRFAGHDDIGKNQVGKLVADLGFRVTRIWNGHHVVSANLEQFAHQHHGVWIVIHYKDASRAPLRK